MILSFLAVVTFYSCVGLPNAEMKALNCPNDISASGKELRPWHTAACSRERMGQVIRIQNTIVECIDITGGKNHIDIYVNDYETAINLGKQQHEAKLLTN